MNNYLISAMMLLEMGIDGLNPEYGTLEDYAAAAHDLIQAHPDGKVPFEVEQLVARIMMDSLLERAASTDA